MNIIQTKFFSPVIKSTHLVRTRLIESIDNRLECKLCLISAPAGFGKSSAVACWGKERNIDLCWYQIDELDAQPYRFLFCLLTAIQTQHPKVFDHILPLVSAKQTTPVDQLIVLITNTFTQISSDIYLVVDDFHLLDDASTEQIFAQLIEYAPSNVHWFIVTREDPNLPLAKWRVQNEVNEIRALQLRFTEQETALLLEKQLQIALSQQDVSALFKRTEGWIAGIQMATLSLREHSQVKQFMDDLDGNHRFVADYFIAEVLEALDDNTRTFIEKTCFLNRINVALCESVTGLDECDSILTTIEQSNLFLIPLDSRRSWYRYHHLFAEVVQVRTRLTKHEIHDLHTRATNWYLENNFTIDAIEHAFLAKDFPLAAELVELHWPYLRNNTPEQHFEQWMTLLPDNHYNNRPVLCAFLGLLLLSKDLSKGFEWLDRAESLIDDKQNNAVISNIKARELVPALIAIGKAYLSLSRGQFNQTIPFTDQALALLPADEYVWRGSVEVLRGIVQWQSGDLNAARIANKQAAKVMAQSQDASAYIATQFLYGNIAYRQGRVTEALDVAQSGLRYLTKVPHANTTQGHADLLVLQAFCQLELTDADAALTSLNQAQSLGSVAQLEESRYFWHFARAKYFISQGNYQSALLEIDNAEAVYSPNPTPLMQSFSALKTEVHWLLNNTDMVNDWLDENSQLVNELPHCNSVYDHALFIRLSYTRCESLELPLPQSYINQVQKSIEENGLRKEKLTLLLAECSHNWIFDNKNQAVVLFKQALRDADQHKLIFTLTATPITQTILSAYPELSELNPLTNLNQSDQQTLDVINSPPALLEPLSEREQQVLVLLNSSLSGPEIAKSLFVSLNTLRTHSKKIYAKLGVNSRREAIEKAKSLSLL